MSNKLAILYYKIFVECQFKPAQVNEKLGTIHELRIDEGLGQNYAMAPVYE